MSETKLKPCPFCGGKAQYFYNDDGDFVCDIDVSCTDESCWFCIKDTNYVGSFPPRDTFEEAAELWNRRADSALLEAAEEVLKEGCNAKRCAFPPSVEIPNCKKCPMAKLKAAVENAKGIIPPVS